MTLPAPGSHFGSPSQSGRLTPPSMADLRRKVHARLADRVDPVRNRHKPLSLLRQDARRLVEQFFDAECPVLPKSERDSLVEDVLAEATGVTPLEELFRDEAVKEILILAPGQVIARKADTWLPTSVRFRDDAQFRAVLARFAELGENLASNPPPAGGFEVRLANGFRASAVVPPDVMNVPPMALFVRAVGTPTPILAPPLALHSTGPGSGVQIGGGRPSGAMPAVGPGSGSRLLAPPPPRTVAPDSGIHLGVRPSGMIPAVGSSSGTSLDPEARVRQKVTQRIINQLASAGVYDLGKIPMPDLRKIVAAFVHEQCEWDRLAFDQSTQDRLALEILAGMNR